MNQILLRIGKAIKDYYNQVNTLGKTEEEFSLWIESLEEPMKSNFKSKGLEYCKNVLNFQRFKLELHDFGMDEYLKNNLTEEDFSYYLANK
jgi:hypothetical protein